MIDACKPLKVLRLSFGFCLLCGNALRFGFCGLSFGLLTRKSCNLRLAAFATTKTELSVLSYAPHQGAAIESPQGAIIPISRKNMNAVRDRERGIVHKVQNGRIAVYTNESTFQILGRRNSFRQFNIFDACLDHHFDLFAQCNIRVSCLSRLNEFYTTCYGIESFNFGSSRKSVERGLDF